MREGHARVPASKKWDGLRLGPWVSRRRSEGNAARLTPERVATLEAIPGWTWDPHADAWETGLAALRAFVAREGHARVAKAEAEGLSVAMRKSPPMATKKSPPLA